MKSTTEVRVNAYRDGWTGAIQIDIGAYDTSGGGVGFRLAGPKFNGSSQLVASCKLKRREIDQIRRYLDQAEALLLETK